MEDWRSMVPPSVAVAALVLVTSLGLFLLFHRKRPVYRSVTAGDAEIDCIIVGAGIAGASLAYALGKDGRKVLLIERNCSRPDRIVGELLQPGGYLKLVELGMQDCVDGIEAQRVLGYALFKDGLNTRVSYPLEGQAADVAGRSFHHGLFVEKLRNKAASVESVRLVEGTVRSLIEEAGVVRGVRYKMKGEEDEREVYAPITFVCDGYSSKLRENLCKPMVDTPSWFIGLILENCQLPHPNHGHVILAKPSPILFYPISNTEIRCLVDCPQQEMDGAKGRLSEYLISKVAPQLPPELQDAFIAAAKSNIRKMENKIMPAAPIPKPGALLLGDAFNMRHPLTGGGMTVALSDIVVLRDMLKPLENFQDSFSVCKHLRAFYTRRKPVASTINTLAGALYRVFCWSDDVAMQEMRNACFDYLRLGWIFSSGPVALLSGLNPRPLSLVMHFFFVALYGVGRLALTCTNPAKLCGNMIVGCRLLKGASNIIFPIIQSEGVLQMFCPRLAELLRAQ